MSNIVRDLGDGRVTLSDGSTFHDYSDFDPCYTRDDKEQCARYRITWRYLSDDSETWLIVSGLSLSGATKRGLASEIPGGRILVSVQPVDTSPR